VNLTNSIFQNFFLKLCTTWPWVSYENQFEIMIWTRANERRKSSTLILRRGWYMCNLHTCRHYSLWPAGRDYPTGRWCANILPQSPWKRCSHSSPGRGPLGRWPGDNSWLHSPASHWPACRTTGSLLIGWGQQGWKRPVAKGARNSPGQEMYR